MRRLLLALAALIATAATTFSAGSALAQLLPQPGFPQDRYSEFTPDPDVRYGTLPNGMRYAIRQWPTPDNEVAIRFRFAAGSLVERDEQAGLMHFLEHMAFNGSENVGENEFDRLLAREGLAFGADTNAATGFEDTSYRLDMPNAERLDLGLMLMRETAGRLLLAQDAIDRERGIIAAEERARDNPSYRSLVAWLRHAGQGLTLTRRLPIGDMNVVRNAPRDLFVELYRGYYTPERAFLVVTGDVEPDRVEAEIRRLFADWQAPANPGPEPTLGTPSAPAGAVALLVDPQLPASMTLTVARPWENLPDTSATRRLFLLRALADGMVNQRLERIARGGSAPFTSASLGSTDFANSVSMGVLEASARDQGSWQATLEAVDLELRRALEHGFTDEEMRVALANVRESYARAAEQAGARRSAGIADQIVSAFAGDSVLTTDAADLAWFDSVAPSLDPAAALAAMRQVWGSQAPTLFLSMPAAVDGGEAAIARIYAAARARPAPAPERLTTQTWDYTSFGAPPARARLSRIPELGVTNARLSNNVRLVVRPSQLERGRVRVVVRFGEGQLAMPDRPGLSIATGAAFVAGGLGRMDVDNLGRALAGRTVSPGFSVGEDAFVFSGVTTAADLELQLQLFAAYMTDPGWRPDGLTRLRAQLEGVYRQISSTPGAVWQTQGAPLLRSGDSRFRFPARAELEAITMDDIRAVMDPALASGAVEVTIVGDITVEQAVAATRATFGTLPRRAARPDPRTQARRVTFTPGRGTDTLVHSGRADQSLTFMFWPMRDYGDGAEVRALRVLESVLQTRLNEVIREEEGTTYSPGTDWSPSTVYPGYGTIGAILELQPQDIDRMTALVERIAADIAAGNISEDLFERARNPLLADFAETQANNPWWVTWLQNSSFDRNRITIIRNGEQQYRQVTLEQTRALAARYLRPDRLRIVRIVPGPDATPVAPAAPAPAAAPATPPGG